MTTRILDDSSSSQTTTTTSTNDSDTVRETLRLYGSLYLCCAVLYCFLRQRYNKYFNIRSWVHEMKCELAVRMQYSGFNWYYKVFEVHDLDLFEQCGMDAVCFLRAMRFGVKVSAVCCVNAIWLLPLYATAEESAQTKAITDPLVKVSVSNLPSSSMRFAGTVVAAYIIFLYTMYLIYVEYEWYTAWRHKFLSTRNSRNYAVYVSGIPRAFRSSSELRKYFEMCASPEAVLEAHIAVDIPQLEAKVARREKIVRRLEHAVAVEKRTGCSSSHISIGLRRGVEKVESVKTFMEELDALNKDIAKSAGEILQKNDPKRCGLQRTSATNDLLAGMRFTSYESDEEHDEDDVDGSLDRRMLSFGDDGSSLDRRVISFGESSHAEGESEENSEDADEECPLVNSSALAEPILEPIPELPENLSPLSREEGRILDETLPILTTISNDGGEDQEHDDSRDHTLNHSANGSICSTESSGEPEVVAEATLAFDDGLPFFNASQSTDLDRAFIVSRSEFESKDISITDHSSRSSRSSRRAHSFLKHSVSAGSKAVSSGFENASVSFSKGLETASVSFTKSLETASETFTKGSKAATDVIKRVAKEVKPERVIQTVSEKGVQGIQKAQTITTHIVTSAAAVVPMLMVKSEGRPRDAGFVLFNNLYTTQTALQMIHHPKPYVMECQPAPEPHDIFWRNVGLPHRAKRTGRSMSIAASAVLCFFWSVPMSFIAALTQVNSLKQTMPKLGEFIENHPGFERVFAQLAPLLLLFFNETILPGLLKWFAAWEGHVSASMLEVSLFTKLGAFMIIQTFFVSAMSGAITSEIANILDDPGSVITLLANSLPAQAAYFMQIILASTFLLQSLEMLRVYPLTVAFLRRYCFGPKLTARERQRSWGMFRSLEDPPEFWHAETFAQLILYFMVSFVYATIAPMTSFLLFFCFLLIESGYRYQFIHNYPREFDTGGMLWKNFIHFILACMVIAQLALIGLLLLKQSKFASPALGPLLGITIMFIIFINTRHAHVSSFLPTRESVIKDRENKRVGLETAVDFKNTYLQPALQNKPCEPVFEDDDEDENHDHQELDEPFHVVRETSSISFL